MEYQGQCPICNQSSKHNIRWLKEENGQSVQYCQECKRIFTVKFDIDCKNEIESQLLIEELEKGILIVQYNPNFVSGFSSQKVYVKNYDEFIQIPWIEMYMKNFKNVNDNFQYFAFIQNNTNRSIISYWPTYNIIAQFDTSHWVVAYAFGDPEKVLGLRQWENQLEK